MAQTTLISSIKRSVYYPTEYILSSPYRCGTFSLIVDTGTWTEQMYYELPCLQLDIYTTISGVDVKYLSCNITLDTDNPMEPYTVSLYEVPETFKVKLTPGFDNDAVTSHKALCNQLNIPNTWVEETTDFNCELIWDNDNIKSGGGGTVDEVARSSIATHTSRTDNPHTVTKAQVGLSDVVNVDTSTTANIIDSTDKRFVTDTNLTTLSNTSGTNTGDENTTTIISKIGYTPENTLNKGVNNGYCALDSGGKVPLQNLPSTLLKYIGTWNAETNTPSLTATDLTKVSHVYVVSHSGTQFGIIWKAGDWLIYGADGLVDKSDNSDDVVSVNGKTGIVVINKADVGLSNVDNTSDLDKPISTLTQTALNLKADKSGLTTHTNNTSNPHGVTKAQVGLSNVVNVNTTTTANITDSTDKRFITDVQRTLLNNTSGSNTGDETTSTIQSKLGVSSATTDGYLTKEDFTTFNNKANIEEVTPISHTTNTSNPHGVTKAQVGLANVVNVDTSVTTNIADTTTKRFVSDTEKTMWGIQKNERPGITWTSVSTVANEWYDCAFGNGRFVAVSPTGTNRVGISVDGTNWNTYAVPTFDFRAIAFGNGVFVAVANVGTNRVMYSVDGIAWTSVTVPLNTWWSITYGNGLFVATSMAGTNKVMYSTNGVNWTPVVAPSEIGEIRDITYGNGLFLAVARTGTHRVMYSTDAITWTPVVVSISNWNGIAFGNGRFVVVANSGDNRVMYSTDGINWTPVVVNLTQWLDVTYGNGLFVAVGEDTGNRSMYSLDAVTWYYNIIPTSAWRKVIYVDNMFMAFASSGTVRIMLSGSYLYLDKVRVVKKSVIGELPVTILSTEWTGTGPFEDTTPITISGEQITNTTHDIKVSLVLSSDITIAKQEQEAYSYFSKGEISATNTLKITCFDYKPTVNLNLTLEVVKKW